MKFGERAGWCVTLGIVLAQPRSCPQTSASAGFCPRCHNSGNRAWCTGLAATQVRVSLGKTGVVHTPGHALLLRLCIYRKHKKKTGDKSSAPAPAGSGGSQSRAKGRGAMARRPLPPEGSAPAFHRAHGTACQHGGVRVGQERSNRQSAQPYPLNRAFSAPVRSFRRRKMGKNRKNRLNERRQGAGRPPAGPPTGGG